MTVPVNVCIFPLIINGNVTFTYGLEKISAKFRTSKNFFPIADFVNPKLFCGDFFEPVLERDIPVDNQRKNVCFIRLGHPSALERNFELKFSPTTNFVSSEFCGGFFKPVRKRDIPVDNQRKNVCSALERNFELKFSPTTNFVSPEFCGGFFKPFRKRDIPVDNQWKNVCFNGFCL